MSKKTNRDEELPTQHYEGRELEGYKLGQDERLVEAVVPFDLTTEEKLANAKEQADLTITIEAKEQEAKDAAASVRKEIKELKKSRRELAKEYKAGTKTLVAQCVEKSNFPLNKIIVFPHPGHPQERQIGEPMPLERADLQVPLISVDGDENDDEPTTTEPKKKLGRPKGSKNKTSSASNGEGKTTHRPTIQ